MNITQQKTLSKLPVSSIQNENTAGAASKTDVLVQRSLEKLNRLEGSPADRFDANDTFQEKETQSFRLLDSLQYGGAASVVAFGLSAPAGLEVVASQGANWPSALGIWVAGCAAIGLAAAATCYFSAEAQSK